MASVLVILGSASDTDIVRPCMGLLSELGISFQATISSAHRSPERTQAIVAKAESEGTKVFICAAGMAAHLAGAVAARTIRPVIGIPLAGPALSGMDSLFSTVQMPSGFPVATVAINGAANAAWLAAQILATGDAALAQRINESRKNMQAAIEDGSARLAEQFPGTNVI